MPPGAAYFENTPQAPATPKGRGNRITVQRTFTTSRRRRPTHTNLQGREPLTTGPIRDRVPKGSFTVMGNQTHVIPAAAGQPTPKLPGRGAQATQISVQPPRFDITGADRRRHSLPMLPPRQGRGLYHPLSCRQAGHPHPFAERAARPVNSQRNQRSWPARANPAHDTQSCRQARRQHLTGRQARSWPPGQLKSLQALRPQIGRAHV